MRIAGFGLGSVKGFDDFQRIGTRGITLIYGGNSSGKSSIIQSLLLLKQSILLPQPLGMTSLEFRGGSIDLGGFRTFVHNHDPRRSLDFSLDLTQIRPKAMLGRSAEISLSFGTRGDDDRTASLLQVQISDEHGEILFEYDEHRSSMMLADKQSAASLTERLGRTVLSEHSNAIDGNVNTKDLAWLRQWMRDRSLRTFGWIPTWWPGDVLGHRPGRPLGGKRGSVREQLAQLFSYEWYSTASDLMVQLRQCFDKVAYVAPLREFPRRVVTESASGTGVGSRGERLVLHLAKHHDLVRRVNEAFAKLDLPYLLSVNSLGSTETFDALGDVAVAVLEDSRSGVHLSPADVGFGVSQVLPVLVQLLGQTNSHILIEQPEIHLHPKMQARLADILIESAIENGNRLIIETHSEHILSRMQRRIRERSYTPTNGSPFRVLYVSSSSGNSRVTDLRIDRQGRMMSPWPDDFLDERLDDLIGSI